METKATVSKLIYSLFLQHSPMAVLISKAKHAIQGGNVFLYSGK